MKAIIMAGGEGVRLRPLTCDCPKPMVPVMDRPVMEYALQLLKNHGITDIGVTLQYLPNRVTDHFGDGEGHGVKLRYFVEETPLGTAGSVKQAQAFLDECFIVLSGDGLTDCDLTTAIDAHRRSGALATMVLKKLDNPLEYGVVVLGEGGRVQRFVEKPGWGEVFSDTVNTGIYILEPQALSMIPSGKAFDFGRELFPQMVEAGHPVFGHIMDGYWCDIGDLGAYLRAHIDALDGRVKLISVPAKSGVIKSGSAMIDRGALIEGPCYIGAGARIEQGAKIGPYSVIGSGCLVRERASVKRAVLWTGARVGVAAQVRGSVLTNAAHCGDDASMFEESVLADGASLGANGTLMPGVKVWPGKKVAPGTRLLKSLIWGGTERELYVGGRLLVQSATDAVRGAEAFACAQKPVSCLIGRDASIESLSHARAASAAMIALGVQLVELGTCTLPQLRHAVRQMGADGALFVAKDEMLPMAAGGLDLIKSDQRRLRAALSREDGACAFSMASYPPVAAPRTDLMYLQMLRNTVDAEAMAQLKPRVAVFSEDQQLLSIAERAMLRCGITVRAEWEREMMDLDAREIGVYLSDHGERVDFADELGMLSEPERQMLLAWAQLERGARRLIVPVGASEGVLNVAERYGAQVVRARSERAEQLVALAGEGEASLLMETDALFAALQVVSALAKSALSMRGVIRTMPSLYQKARAVQIELRDKGGALKALAERYPDADLSDGIRLTDARGWAWISPGGDRRECRVLTESMSAEVAKELCDFYSNELLRALKGEGREER